MTRMVAVESAIGPNHTIDADLISSVTWGWMGQDSVRLGLDGENFAIVTGACAQNMRQAGMLPGFPPVPTAPLLAEDGAEMIGRIEATDDDRFQASYWIQLNEGWRIRTEDTVYAILESEASARLWLQEQAGKQDFPRLLLLA